MNKLHKEILKDKKGKSKGNRMEIEEDEDDEDDDTEQIEMKIAEKNKSLFWWFDHICLSEDLISITFQIW